MQRGKSIACASCAWTISAWIFISATGRGRQPNFGRRRRQRNNSGAGSKPPFSWTATQRLNWSGWRAAIQPSWSFARFLVFHENEDGAAGQWIRVAEETLQPLAPSAEFAVGSNAYFAELNRNRPETAEVDAIVYPITPQVHAFDETSMIENLEAQAVTVQTARSWAGRRRLVVSPVTLKPRFNANATEPEAANAPRELPASVDPRQMSLFAAAWTLGSVKYLAESGASSATYYETTGWRGVMETGAGSPLPARFPSAPALLFPLYHLFLDLARWKSSEIVSCKPTDPLRVVGLAFRKAKGCHLLAANLTAEPQIVRLVLPGVCGASCRTLDAGNAPAAMKDPEFFAAAQNAGHCAGTNRCWNWRRMRSAWLT